MCEENTQTDAAATGASVEAKIAQGLGKVDAIVEKVLGIVGDRPWEKWLSICNCYVSRFLPAAIALAGVLAFVIGLISAIRYDMPISSIFSCLGILVMTAFSMHLAPKALALSRSFIEKGELESMRPELIYINKVLFGLGGILAAVCLLFQFDGESLVAALVIALFAVLCIIVYSNPAIVGVKADYPQNSVEETVTLMMFPIKFVLALLTPIIGLAVVGGVVYGIVLLFDNGMSAAIELLVTALVPFLLPLAVYFIYLLLTFGFEFYRALVSVPRRLEDVRKALSGK